MNPENPTSQPLLSEELVTYDKALELAKSYMDSLEERWPDCLAPEHASLAFADGLMASNRIAEAQRSKTAARLKAQELVIEKAKEALEAFGNGSSMGASHPHLSNYVSFDEKTWHDRRAALALINSPNK